MVAHYDISYTNLAPEAKRAQAIQDIKNHLGVNKYDELTEVIHRDFQLPFSLDDFRMALVMSGIHGYPVLAWHEVLWPGEEGESARAVAA